MLSETKTSVFQGEDGEIFAYGHVDKLDFIEDILVIWDYLDQRSEMIDSWGLPKIEDIRHNHAHLVMPDGISVKDFDPDQHDLWFNFCGSGHPDAFPLTIFDF